MTEHGLETGFHAMFQEMFQLLANHWLIKKASKISQKNLAKTSKKDDKQNLLTALEVRRAV
jgi:hypothetical protein